MASEQVIELGSSDDDEAEPPPPKKAKPPLNAMVQFPHKLPGITIKRSNTNKSKTSVIGAIVKNSPQMVKNPYSTKVIKQINQNATPKKVIAKKIVSNAVGMIKINKVASLQKPMVIPNLTAQYLKTQIVKTLPKIQLPPGITITQTNKPAKPIVTSLLQGKRPVGPTGPLMPFKKIKLQKQVTPEVVNLEEDAPVQPSSSNPQWYVRPEDQNTSMEAENNKEPVASNMIEITIEDSPVKPQNKRTLEIEKEIAITIDDSPVKTTDKCEEKDTHTSGSEEESRDPKTPKTPQSRKKLLYPKESLTEMSIEKIDKIETKKFTPVCEIEIEFEPLQSEELTKKDEKVTDKNDKDVIEIPESPNRTSNASQNATPKKKKPEDGHEKKAKDSETQQITKENESQFHPVYQTFIDLCFELENSDDMNQIVERKIKAYYLKVPKDYTESEEFIEMVSCKVDAMRASPERMYLYIKDIVDELSMQKKMAKSKLKKEEDTLVSLAPDVPIDDDLEDTEQDIKRKRHIRQLEKTLRKLHRAIHKLEEQEVDFDDDGDSVYLLTERYKERLVRVHAKLLQLSNTKMPSEPRLRLEPRAGRPAGPARRLEKWINRRVPLGTPLPFPDFHDVLRCVRAAALEDGLRWNEADVMEEARELFTRCGRKLQRRRQENEWRLAAWRAPAAGDPAAASDELKQKLQENRKLAAQREADLINKFADKEKQMKLVAVEIGDKEADESPVESGDEVQDEANEDGDLLENKEGRKDRIKRLLKENTRRESGMSKDYGSENKDKSKELNETEDIEMAEDKVENDDRQNAVTKVEQISASKKSESPKETVVTAELKSQKEEKSSKNSDKELDNAEEVQVLSDDSKELDSDVDELHLLEKLHSESEHYSSPGSSGSATPISISDTLGSGDEIDNSKKGLQEIVSIENSTESEQEETQTDNENKPKSEEKHNAKVTNDKTTKKQEETIKDKDILEEEIEFVDDSSQEHDSIKHNSNDEYAGPLEDILLASTDDESNGSKNYTENCKEMTDLVYSSSSNKVCVNLKDDALSIGETVIDGADDAKAVKGLKKSAENDLDSKLISDEKNDTSEAKENEMDVDGVIETENTSGSEINVINKVENQNVSVIIKEAPEILEESTDVFEENDLKTIENNIEETKTATEFKETQKCSAIQKPAQTAESSITNESIVNNKTENCTETNGDELKTNEQVNPESSVSKTSIETIECA